MTSKGSVLVIAHAFPPSGGAGVRRVSKVVKYLAHWGWNVMVLAPKRGKLFAYPYDPRLCSEIPTGVQVIETTMPESWLMTSSVARGKNTKTENFPPTRSASASIYKSLYKTLGGFIAIPESAITWLPSAVWRGRQIIAKHNIDILFATAPPFSTLLIGAALKKLTGTPLVVEFRDAWTTEPVRNQNIGLGRRQIEKLQEAWIVRSADKIVSVTPGVTSDFVRRYHHLKQTDRFVTIPNGFDRADTASNLTNKGTKSKDDKFTIVHTGTLGGVRTPLFFLQSIHRLLTERPSLRSRLRIIFVGHCASFSDGATIDDYVQHLNLRDVVEITGFVSREESLHYQNTADLLLLLVGIVSASDNERYGLSAKAFDYTLASRPVLAITEAGATEEYIRSAGIGEVVSHYDGTGIIAAVENALEGKFHYAPQQAVIDEYDYATLISRLESVLLACSSIK
jgi:glycosyltransferase involved in cell wall biosynthesis